MQAVGREKVQHKKVAALLSACGGDKTEAPAATEAAATETAVATDAPAAAETAAATDAPAATETAATDAPAATETAAEPTVAVGGWSNVFGSLLGDVLVTVLPDVLKFLGYSYWLVFYLIVFVIAIIMPGGLVSIFTKGKTFNFDSIVESFRWMRRKKKK